MPVDRLWTRRATRGEAGRQLETSLCRHSDPVTAGVSRAMLAPALRASTSLTLQTSRPLPGDRVPGSVQSGNNEKILYRTRYAVERAWFWYARKGCAPVVR